MKNIKNYLYVCLFTLLCSFIKLSYYDFIREDYIRYELENVFLYLDDSVILNLMWLAQIMIIIIFLMKNIVEDLNTFDHRYRNRKQYIKVIVKKNSINTLGIVLMNYIIQLWMFVFIKNVSFDWEAMSMLFFLYYNVILLSTLLVISMYIIFKKEAISMFVWVLSVNVLQMLLSNLNLELFQVLYNHNVWLLVLMIDFSLFLLIYRNYLKKDFGGNDYEFRS